jgi:hypothetical protein
MYDPKTNTTLNCSAREAPGQNVEILYDAVETCARQLEARGFIRVETKPPAENTAPGTTASKP